MRCWWPTCPTGLIRLIPKTALTNAARFVKEGGAEVVKIEGGEKRADLIRRIMDAEIPVAGHIGLTPQSVNVMGGYKVQGKNLGGIEQLMRDAVALDRAGVACLYLEGIPREVAAMITAEVSTPTIGIGAGPDCDGQVLVFHDIVNLTFGPPAKFVRRYGGCGGAHHPRRAGLPRGRKVASVSVGRGVVSSAQRNQGQPRNRAGAEAGDAAVTASSHNGDAAKTAFGGSQFDAEEKTLDFAFSVTPCLRGVILAPSPTGPDGASLRRSKEV